MTSSQDVAGRLRSGGQDIQRSRWFGVAVTVGLISFGVVHLLIAWIALQIAFTGGGGEASQQGAFAQLSGNAVGRVLLWVVVLGLVAMAVWQAITAVWGHTDVDGGKRTRKRLASAGKTVVYLALAVSAASTAASGAKSGSAQDKSMTARLLGVAFGRVLVVLIGLAVVAVAGVLIYQGVTKKFTEELAGSPGRGVVLLGQIGFCGKGVAFVVVGVLFVVAAVTADPNRAGGLDSALRTLRGQPFGVVLLTLVALGIAAFGGYCFAWSRHIKRS